ncbi:uncharacterized protein LOC127262337 [Andrographis paniculata]|uniref:uncharacterized protein LOC127262337 n=1 Tax=Andrographis paniculata TaxID=175694 RepID=UPI0021E94843|nr:uncharacterized protein LOC127262337 [Andrographis paniculata]
MATASSATMAVPAVVAGPARPSGRRARVNYIAGLNSFDGLRAHCNVASLGLPVSADQSFAKIVSSLKQPGRRGGGGGALGSTCSAVDEIFRIAAILPALVLIGVAVGFVLLRLEATLEEE